uniref:Uncharacterized protein n=1 Tax=Cyprinus carpio carpio TaxID=630221 RepID=A0A9J8BEY5_CYPCA
NIGAIHSKYIFTLVQWKIVIFSLYLLFSLCLKVSVTPSRQTLKHYFYLNGSLRLNQSFGVSCDHVTSLRLGTSQSLKISAVRHYLASQAKDHLHVRVCEKTQLNKVVQRDEAETELASSTMAVFVIREEGDSLQPPHDIGVVIEGVKVLNRLPSVAHACAMLFGLIYVLNLSYPGELEHTFDALQKLFMEIEPKKMTRKVLSLSVKL